jgi:hypothetical protein
MAIPSLYARIFDQDNQHWSSHPEINEMFLLAQQEYANYRLNAQGYLFLNDVYDMLGFKRTSNGQLVGWLKGDGNFVDFSMAQVSLEATLLDFNVDGVIYEQIDKL